ncbi:hypothetical protein [Halohasta litorea]|uniref:VOC domain-containing protein n=1 Tax=Halohasta litorea TaxID=869891 RepID=A0ABD6D5Q5_9EURY|nr:hypothetical protein [Halohasta litorea]
MRFEQVAVPAADPAGVAAWYRSRFAPSGDSTADASAVRLGETTLQFTDADNAPLVHLAFRLLLDGDRAVDWLADRATILPVEGEPSRRFEFLDATAIYFEDAAGNVLEGLAYDGDPRQRADSGVVDGVTEVGLPAQEPLALVEWLEESVGLSAWGTPSESFAWVGDRHARFVVIPTGQEWYPTDRAAAPASVSVTVADESAPRGRYSHPTLPYEVRIVHNR